jgi:magnesium chelatase family protein
MDKDVFYAIDLPDAAVRESRHRLRAAIKNSGYAIPPAIITISLVPADMNKEGEELDPAHFRGHSGRL